MKYFIFADPHGHYTELKEALLAAGYDETNDNHHLIGLGDYFDRGSENDKMAEFIIDQHEKGKATFILGNHDEMLLEVLGFVDDGIFNCIHNGMDKTIDQLSKSNWHMLKYDQEHIVRRINRNYPKLKDLLLGMKHKIEIGNFVLTHAGYSNTHRDPYFTDKWEVNNWAKTDFFVKWFQTSDDFVLQKTYIFGHWHAFDLRQIFGYSHTNKPTPEPFVHKNFVGLDACTVITKKVNIYIIDEEVV